MSTQTLTTPKTWSLLIGTSSQPLIPANGNRTALWLHNPAASGGATVSLCSAFGGGPGNDGVATLNGAGTLTVPPGAIYTLDTLKWTDALNGIAGAGSTPFTIIEFS